MVDSPPQKRGEQYPLLLVSGGGGDVDSQRAPPRGIPTVLSSVWNVSSCNPKPWFDRLPEFVSTCWMTLILLGISFLVFYAIGMVAYKQEPFVIVKCNNTQPASDVYLHHIFPRDSYVPFTTYSEYLSTLAIKYPYLRFNVIFLQEDQMELSIFKHSKFYTKLLPYQTTKLYEEYNKREMATFQKRYQNVIINVVPISKYMAKTPLKYKWRTIPPVSLPFYARAFSIWQTGGVALDLSTYNHQYKRSRHLDSRIESILKQHNGGIKINNYINALNNINNNKEKEFFKMFSNIIGQIINETRTFFNQSLPFPPTNADIGAHEDEPLIRTHRNKRELSEPAAATSASNNAKPVINLVLANTTVAVTDDAKENVYHVAIDKNTTSNISQSINSNQLQPIHVHNSNEIDVNLTQINKTDNSNNKSLPVLSRTVMIYDILVVSDENAPIFQNGPPKFSPFDRFQEADTTKQDKMGAQPTLLVAIESEGHFMSATSALHPFLGLIISGGCKQLPPKLAIQDALVTQCSGAFRDDIYCDNIFLL